MKERKSMIVMKVFGACLTFVCIRHFNGSETPFELIVKWYDGKTHRKKVGNFPTIQSVLSDVSARITRAHNDGVVL